MSLTWADAIKVLKACGLEYYLPQCRKEIIVILDAVISEHGTRAGKAPLLDRVGNTLLLPGITKSGEHTERGGMWETSDFPKTGDNMKIAASIKILPEGNILMVIEVDVNSYSGSPRKAENVATLKLPGYTSMEIGVLSEPLVLGHVPSYARSSYEYYGLRSEVVAELMACLQKIEG